MQNMFLYCLLLVSIISDRFLNFYIRVPRTCIPFPAVFYYHICLFLCSVAGHVVIANNVISVVNVAIVVNVVNTVIECSAQCA